MSDDRDEKGRFVKGHKPSEKSKKKMSDSNKGKVAWNKGKKLSEEHIKKLSESHKGYKLSEETKRKISLANKGHITSEETRKKISKSNMGKKLTKETKEKIRKSHLGKISPKKGIKLSLEVRKKMSESHKGQISWNKGQSYNPREKHWNWQGGKCKRRLGVHDWKLIRKQVLIKFEFKCVHCGEISDLCIHHKIPYRICNEDKIENLIPLCRSCHVKEERRNKYG